MKQIKRTISLTLITSLTLMLVFFVLEPEVSQGAADSVDVTQAVSSEITISAPDDVSMSPSIPGLTGGTANGSATWNVKTNDTSGFNMTLKEGNAAPALISGANNFADYTFTTTPEYDWSVAAADSEFGFTVEPATAGDTVAAFLDDGSTPCGTGSTNTPDKCWRGFDGTTPIAAINRTSGATSSSGENEVVKFRAQSGASHFQAEGSYTATITATVVTN